MSRKPPVFNDHPLNYTDARSREVVRAICQHIVDGDTADFLLDLGWHQYAYFPLRLYGIGAPETRGTSGPVLERALSAKQRLADLTLYRPCIVRSYAERRTFERYVADVWVLHDGSSGFPLRGRLRIAGTEWVHVQQILLEEGLVDLI